MVYEYLGYISGFFYIVCFLPQIYTTWYGKSDKLSIYMVLLQMMGALFMISYAYLNQLYPILMLNGLTILCLLVIMLGMYYTM